MSNFTFRFSLSYLNILGIFCCSFHNNQITVSRFWKYFCAFRILTTYLFQVALYYKILINEFFVIVSMPHLKNCSNFTIFLLLLTNLSMVFSTTSINILAFGWCKNVKMLLNQAMKLYSSLDSEFQLKTRKKLRNLNCIAVIASLFFIRVLSTVLNVSVFSVLLGFIVIPLPITFVCFLCLMKGSEQFFEMSLQSFNKQIQTATEKNEKEIDCSTVMIKYEKLYEFCENINKAFGAQITIATSTLFVVSTLDVRPTHF